MKMTLFIQKEREREREREREMKRKEIPYLLEPPICFFLNVKCNPLPWRLVNILHTLQNNLPLPIFQMYSQQRRTKASSQDYTTLINMCGTPERCLMHSSQLETNH
jgi:hypothetical protein